MRSPVPLQRGLSQSTSTSSLSSSAAFHTDAADADHHDHDFESGVCGSLTSFASEPSYTTLSSAEFSFDRLLQSVSYEDRCAFAAYVRAEVDKDIDPPTTQMTTTNNNTMTMTTSDNNLNGSLHRNAYQRVGKLVALYGSLPSWWRGILDRFALLAGLLFLQSCSSVILSHFADFIQKHVVVTLFLTMLVGAGGNAGNQAAVLVIRMLATSSRRVQPMAILWKEIKVAAIIGIMMVIVGFGRVYIFESGDIWAAVAITSSLYLIVTVSIILGAALPLLLHRLRFDPAHAGPIIQVIMDVLGVLVTCVICSMILNGEQSDTINTNTAGRSHTVEPGHTIAG